MFRNKETIENDKVEVPHGDDLLWDLQAEVCTALAHAKRLKIIHILKDGEMAAGALVREMGIAKANLSQHLTVLRRHGILRTRREGTRIFYRVAHPKIIEACSIMRGVLLETLGAREGLARSLRAVDDGNDEREV
jgi:ArsR family transcriptional regulator, virulence genes transcriptional regulator